MWAVAETHPDAVRVLLEAGASVGARSLTGFTALLFAAREGDCTVAQLLLDGGADVNESSDDGSTPLLVAAVRGHVELAMLLLARGAAPEGNPEAAVHAASLGVRYRSKASRRSTIRSSRANGRPWPASAIDRPSSR